MPRTLGKMGIFLEKWGKSLWEFMRKLEKFWEKQEIDCKNLKIREIYENFGQDLGKNLEKLKNKNGKKC